MPDKTDGFDSMFSVAFLVAGIIALAPTLQKIFAATPSAQALAAQSYTGLTDYKVLDADEQLRWVSLDVPWVTASFFNEGDVTVAPPGQVSAYIAVNNPNSFVELKKGDSQNADFSFAQRRIEIIFYKADKGKHARVRVVGKY